MIDLSESWKPEFGTIVTWFAMDKYGRIAVMVNNCFGDLPRVLLAVDGVGEVLYKMSEFVWEESEGDLEYPDDKRGWFEVDLFSAWRYKKYPSLSKIIEEFEQDWHEMGHYSEANLAINKGLFVYHGVEGDNPGVDYPVGYVGTTEMGDYFRHLVPTVMGGIVDFPEGLRCGIVVSDSVDFMSDRVLKSGDISRLFTRMYR
ncbi:hypothetical protein [Pseudomonas sp. PH1b]|uniref:hypothetical protein n=1 Tax=Pseudomonas sp. PH1b TaxID=1397282 RepID=UPI0009DCF8C4|nr:hypothetical protein [Pseudomonas sp. PH1b]